MSEPNYPDPSEFEDGDSIDSTTVDDDGFDPEQVTPFDGEDED